MRPARAAFMGAALLYVAVLIGPAALPAFGHLTGPRPGIGFGVPVALAASPEPSSAAGDTRSAGEAPGFVGAPLLALGAVLVLGAAAVLGTVGYVRLTGGPGRATSGTDDVTPPR